jgi:HAD superfamily hydrolase (TIGR01509 family)
VDNPYPVKRFAFIQGQGRPHRFERSDNNPYTAPMNTAIIFDMDGVIADTQKLQAAAEAAVLKEHGIIITPAEITNRFAGITNRDWFPVIFKEHQLPYDLADLIEAKWAAFDKLAAGGIEAVPGTSETIINLAAAGFVLGVGSASRKSCIESTLSTLGLTKYFTAVTSADEVKRGKPDPAIFLLTAGKLKTPPEQCVVVEDGVSGMVAAQRAGMKCVALVREPQADVSYPANMIVDNLLKLPIERWAKI